MLEQEVKEANSGDRGFIYMVAYELFSYDEKNGYEFIGILPERRKDPKRITKESVLNWGRMILGNNTDGKKIFFKCKTIDDVSGETFEVNSPFNDY
jgi:hypothetical protein